MIIGFSELIIGFIFFIIPILLVGLPILAVSIWSTKQAKEKWEQDQLAAEQARLWAEYTEQNKQNNQRWEGWN